MRLATDITPDALLGVEDTLLSETGGERVFWTGRASTALVCALRALQSYNPARRDPEVIVPSIACPSLINVVVLSGFKPRFADIDPATGLLDLEAVEVCASANCHAVVFVHLYGSTGDVGLLARWCRNRGIALIEDCAQALGARTRQGDWVGGLGDFGVFSFNTTKLLECGGGALVARTPQTAEAVEHALERDPGFPGLAPEVRPDLASGYAELQRRCIQLLRNGVSKGSSDFAAHFAEFHGLYVNPTVPAKALAAAWDGLASELDQRRERAREYRRLLAHGPWTHLDGWEASGVCWRFSLLFDDPDTVSRWCDGLRSDGFHVSTLFWPLHQLYDTGDVCPHADWFGRRVVNLWVDTHVDFAYVRSCAKRLRDLVGMSFPLVHRA